MNTITSIINFFKVQNTTFDLDLNKIKVEPIINWGGFTNSSFTISDDKNRYHLKLAQSPSPELSLFFKVSKILHIRYHSPMALAWIEIPDIAQCGILFESVESKPFEALSRSTVLKIAEILKALQNDYEIKQILSPMPIDCKQTYLNAYNERFESDLGFIETNLPSFLSEQTFDFLKEESIKLKHIVLKSRSFDEIVATPIHSDIWAGNILMKEDGQFNLIDWDGLKIGDSALDFAMLLGPSGNQFGRREDPLKFGLENISQAIEDRIRIYYRAILLDWSIDPLSDWIEVRNKPEWIDLFRPQKERDHKMAFGIYQELYG